MRGDRIAIAAVLLACACAQAQDNLLPIGGFEEGAGGDSPVGWDFKLEGGGEGSWALNADTVRSGDHSVRIEKTNGLGFLTLTTAEMILAWTPFCGAGQR